jgi:hypothetical protein
MRNDVNPGQTGVLLAEVKELPAVSVAPPSAHDGYPFLNFFQQRVQQNAIFIWVIRQ